MKAQKKISPVYIGLGAFLVFLGLSQSMSYAPGEAMGEHFLSTMVDMVKFLPPAFILISLLDVWIKKENVERHLGSRGGAKGYLWALLLGGITIGPAIVAYPMAHTLYKKEASLSVIFTYLGAAAVCRILMTLFEASYLGVPFTLIRYGVSLPLIVISSIVMGKWLEGKSYAIEDGS